MIFTSAGGPERVEFPRRSGVQVNISHRRAGRRRAAAPGKTSVLVEEQQQLLQDDPTETRYHNLSLGR